MIRSVVPSRDLTVFPWCMADVQRSTVSVELQKRMEDSSDAVRIGILPAIATSFETMPATFSDEAVSAFVNGSDMFKCTLVNIFETLLKSFQTSVTKVEGAVSRRHFA